MGLEDNRFEKGQVLTAAALNRVVDMILRKVTGGPGITVRAFGSQMIIENTKRDAPIGLPDRYAVVVEVKRDVLLCRQWSFSTVAILPGAPLFVVAKATELRGTTWVGLTRAGFAYTSTDGAGEEAGHKTRQSDAGGGDTQDQEVIPNWIESVTEGTVIVAKRVLYTGAVYQGNVVLWRDENDGARAWTKIT